jgi:FAD/FMN-containing dehydrogenase
VYEDTVFENWGLSVKNTPRYTFVPQKVLGLQNLVRYARQNNMRVRCSGYRHSWASIFSTDGEILVSLLNLSQTTVLPDITSIFPSAAGSNEFKTIELAKQSARGTPGKRLVRVGSAVTSEEFRRWAVANNAWALPVDAVLVESVTSLLPLYSFRNRFRTSSLRT